MPDYPADKFTLFSNVNKSNTPGKEDELWALSEWPVSQIMALANWATNEAEKVTNFKGDECVRISQKFLPRTSPKSGNQYFLGIISDAKPKREQSEDELI